MSSSDITIDQLIYKRASKIKGEPLKSSYPNFNQWSKNKVKKIEIVDFYFDMRDVQWKGKVLTVEYELFTMLIKDWMDRNQWSKERALDEFFELS